MEHHNVNAGVVVLSSTLLQNTRENQRLDIEDNIGEGIHIHYKNFRFDLTIKDFIKFANHDKVYMVVADQSDISTGTLTIEPPLTTAVSSSNITYDNVPFTVHLTNDVQEFGAVSADKDGNVLYQFELDVEEAL